MALITKGKSIVVEDETYKLTRRDRVLVKYN